MGETLTSKVSTFSLPKEETIVKVKFVPRKVGMAANVPDNHIISGGMLSKSKQEYYAPLTRNGSIANILTNEEKDYLEKVTQLNLSVYGDFWHTFSVKLYKEDTQNQFDISKPLDYISVKILEKWTDQVAPSWSDRVLKPTYKFAIVRGDEIQDEQKIALDYKKEAFKFYGRIEDDKEKLLGVLKLISNKNISKDSKLSWIQGQVENHIDVNPKSFLDIIQDPSFDTKVLINKALDAGVLLRDGNKLKTSDGLYLAHDGNVASFANAVKYLQDDRHQDVRAMIEAKIEA